MKRLAVGMVIVFVVIFAIIGVFSLFSGSKTDSDIETEPSISAQDSQEEPSDAETVDEESDSEPYYLYDDIYSDSELGCKLKCEYGFRDVGEYFLDVEYEMSVPDELDDWSAYEYASDTIYPLMFNLAHDHRNVDSCNILITLKDSESKEYALWHFSRENGKLNATITGGGTRDGETLLNLPEWANISSDNVETYLKSLDVNSEAVSVYAGVFSWGAGVAADIEKHMI